MRLVPSDKNMGPVWISKHLIFDNTSIILNNSNNFIIDHSSEEEVIQQCANNIRRLVNNIAYDSYINTQQKSLIIKEIIL